MMFARMAIEVDYICYISRTKVDQLYSQVDPLDAGDVTRTSMTSRIAQASLNATTPTILSLIKGTLSVGAGTVIKTEKKAKKQYAEKLASLLAYLDGNNRILLFDQLLSTQASDTNYFSYVGDFKVTTPVLEAGTPADRVISIESKFGSGTLLLDCSLKNFSEGQHKDGSFHVHSGNSSFFSGNINLRLETVAILLAMTDVVIRATPICLVLRFPEKDGSEYDFVNL